MNRFLLIISLLTLLYPGLAYSEKPVIGLTSQNLDDVGCIFKSRHSSNNPRSILIASFFEAWMKIDGKEIKLTEVSRNENDRIFTYKAEGIMLILNQGKPSSLVHDTYPNATITVFKNGKKASVRAKGWCGC